MFHIICKLGTCAISVWYNQYVNVAATMCHLDIKSILCNS